MSTNLSGWKEGMLTKDLESLSGKYLLKGQRVKWRKNSHEKSKSKPIYYYVDVYNCNFCESTEFLIKELD